MLWIRPSTVKSKSKEICWLVSLSVLSGFHKQDVYWSCKTGKAKKFYDGGGDGRGGGGGGEQEIWVVWGLKEITEFCVHVKGHGNVMEAHRESERNAAVFILLQYREVLLVA